MSSKRLELRAIVSIATLLTSGACTQRNVAPQPETTAAPAEEPIAEASPPESELSEEDLLRQIEEQEQLADEEATIDSQPEAEEEQPYRREIVYRVGLNGMKIQLEGVEFEPRAERIKIRGGSGVKLTVTANSNLEQTLLNPKNGPLAFGGSVKRGELEKFGDQRQGDAELRLVPGREVTFSRSWPGPDQKPLASGEELTLQVGLWGLGPQKEDRRPVKRFFVVKMNSDPSSSPSIEPASM